jgi:hypothetical protein
MRLTKTYFLSSFGALGVFQMDFAHQARRNFARSAVSPICNFHRRGNFPFTASRAIAFAIPIGTKSSEEFPKSATESSATSRCASV